MIRVLLGAIIAAGVFFQARLAMSAEAGPAGPTGPTRPKDLKSVFAPVVVGVPPVNAFNGLYRCRDGEIRWARCTDPARPPAAGVRSAGIPKREPACE